MLKFSNLVDSNKEGVYVVSWGAGVQCVFVFLDLHHDKLSHFFILCKNLLMGARKMVHEFRKEVVHLL